MTVSGLPGEINCELEESLELLAELEDARGCSALATFRNVGEAMPTPAVCHPASAFDVAARGWVFRDCSASRSDGPGWHHPLLS
jgi:hypothetical protein